VLQAAEERGAHAANKQHRAEKNHGINAQTALAIPVSVRVKVQPKRKLIQRKRRAHAVAHRHHPAHEDRYGRVRAAQVEQPAVAHQQQDENAPHEMVNVMPAHHHPLEMPLVVHDSMNQEANAGKCDQE